MVIRYTSQIPAPDQFFQLLGTTDWNDTYRLSVADIARALAASWRVVCAYHSDELIGFGRLLSDGVLYATMFDVIVAPHRQRQGIGTGITRRLVEECRAAGIRDVLLFAAKGSMGFYTLLGFEPRTSEAPGMILRLANEW